MSEYFNSIKIPTSRSLGIVKLDKKIKRDFTYQNDIEFESGAINCRIAENFIRFGNFEILSSWN